MFACTARGRARARAARVRVRVCESRVYRFAGDKVIDCVVRHSRRARNTTKNVTHAGHDIVHGPRGGGRRYREAIGRDRRTSRVRRVLTYDVWRRCVVRVERAADVDRATDGKRVPVAAGPRTLWESI